MANPTPAQGSSSASASLDHVIELTGQLDQKLLTTVYWCLGTLVGIFLLLIGLNWFTNFRMHEREVAALRNELSAGLENARSALEQANAKVIEELKNKLADAAKATAEAAVAPLQSQLSTIQSRSDGFQAKFVSQEVDMWAAQKVYWNAIRSQINYLDLVRKTSSWDFNSGLDKLGGLLSKALSTSPPQTPAAHDTATLTRFLTSVEDENPGVVARLRELLAQLLKGGV